MMTFVGKQWIRYRDLPEELRWQIPLDPDIPIADEDPVLVRDDVVLLIDSGHRIAPPFAEGTTEHTMKKPRRIHGFPNTTISPMETAPPPIAGTAPAAHVGRVDQAQAALKKYGRHLEGCLLLEAFVLEPDNKVCTCGFALALKENS